MYKGIAFNTGIMIAAMVSINGLLSGTTGVYFSNLVFQIVGLVSILLIGFFIKKEKMSLRSIPLMYFLPGIFSITSTVLNNVCFNALGATLTLALAMLGQLIMSSFIDHFGLFNMPKIKFKKEKIVGFSIISLGVAVMIIL